jgi:hypothetical protein
MMNVRGSFYVVLTAALVATGAQAAPRKPAAPARAETPATVAQSAAGSPFDGRLELEPHFGFAFVSPADVNNLIRDTNDAIQKQGVKSFQVGEFGSTTGFGLAAAYRVIPAAAFGLGFSRLAATTDGSAKINDNTLFGSYSISANLLTVESRVRFAQSADGKLEGLFSPFAGVGFYKASNEFSGSALQNGSQEVHSTATGAVFGTTIGARYWLSRGFSLGLNAGYRFAKSGTLKVDSQKNTNQAVGSQAENGGKKLSLDASSLLVGAGVTWAL